MNWLETWAANHYLSRLENRMGQNWKGRIGSLGLALSAIASLIVAYSNGTLDVETIIRGVGVVSGALAAFGIRQAVGRAQAGSPAQATTVDTKPPVPAL